LLFCFTFADERAWSAEEETAEFWINESREELAEAIKREKVNTNVAKNVIMFLGDGMGIATITAGRAMRGQLKGKSGEETVLAMDNFPHCGLSKTYSVDKDVSDSATTATAYLCGVKAQVGTIGVNGNVARGDCKAQNGNHVHSILMDAYDQGKSTGIVTSAHITHASPAGTYAHTSERGWYDDTELSADAIADGCVDIAQQLLDQSEKITVGLGGGRKYFVPKEEADAEYPSQTGHRGDGRNLVEEWKVKHAEEEVKYVWNQTGFDAVDPVTTDRLFGLFEPSHMQYVVDEDGAGEPTLAEMTEKAIRILQKNDKGYFLFVEAGRIDHAHHANQAHRALHEFVALDEAVERTRRITSESDTLIVITADHSHTLTMGGYADRGNPILGLAPSNEDPDMASDGKPYTTLLYGTGPGYQSSGVNPTTREEVNAAQVELKDYRQQSAVPRSSATHAGEDVMILSSGPMSHLFHGVHEQNYIPYVMRYASCLGANQDHCNGGSDVVADVVADVNVDVETAAVFLGNDLSYEAASVALYAQFYIILTLTFLMSMTFVSVKSRRRPRASSFAGSDNMNMKSI